MKSWLIRLICAPIRIALRRTPSIAGRRYVWYHIIRPYILGHSVPITAITNFAARIEGDLADVIHSYLYFFGVWEPGITSVCTHHLRPGDVCIDIGANVGAHTLLAAHLVGATGRVHAIEASPTIYRHLIRNLQVNETTQVTPYNIAVTDRTGPVTIYLHDVGNLGGTTIMLSESRSRPTTKEIVTEGRPLSDILSVEEIRAARLIKIDVEGAEWLVLQGMLDVLPLLRQDCLLLLEVSTDALAAHDLSVGDVIALLARNGWHPLDILNSYTPDFYIKPLGRTVAPYSPDHRALIDLGFARLELRNALLQADIRMH